MGDVADISDSDRVEAARRVLAGLASGDDAHRILASVVDLHRRNNTFPGEVFMELAADALNCVGVGRDSRVEYGDLLSKHLGEVELRSKSRSRFQCAVLTSFAVHGGLEPDLLDEVTYWIDQYWQFALYASIAIIRSCAVRSGSPIEDFAETLANHVGIDTTSTLWRQIPT